jgi:hypothetical protein
LSHYEEVLNELRKKWKKMTSEYIPELYNILRDEEQLSPEASRTRIEYDCSDIWTKDTIRKYLPPETKSATKRKAGKISAEVKKKKKERKEPKLLAAIADTSQRSEVLDNDHGTSDNSVEMNPTENGFVGQKEQELSSFGESTDSRDSTNVWTEAYNSRLIVDRQKDEVWELLEDLSLDDCISECVKKSLLLPSRLAEQIYLDVYETRSLGIISDFELAYDGTQVISIRKSGSNHDIK